MSNVILINSINEDYSTDEVIRWLLKWNKNFLRLNGKVKISNIQCNNNSIVFSLTDGKQINLDEITAYWYRRGSFVNQIESLKAKKNTQEFTEHFESHLIKEKAAVLEILQYVLKNNVHCISDLSSSTNINKNIVLLEARDCGLLIPDFLITSQKKEVALFLKRHKRIITKAINITFSFSDSENWYPNYTNELNNSILETLPTTFQSSLFQKRLDKKYDIRSFYLNGEIYSMAIFSQNDTNTETDFRKYNHTKPNRNIPFKLPELIENKLTHLMRKLRLETGSIDLVYTKKNEFYFLEVNPIGQFGMTSYPCNYQLEKKIAKFLTKHQNNEVGKTKYNCLVNQKEQFLFSS